MSRRKELKGRSQSRTIQDSYLIIEPMLIISAT